MGSKIGKIILGFIMALTVFFAAAALWGINEQSESRGTEAISMVINKALLQCYALEGAYPESLDHLADGYGVMFNYELYNYHYEPYGANIFPVVRVLKK